MKQYLIYLKRKEPSRVKLWYIELFSSPEQGRYDFWIFCRCVCGVYYKVTCVTNILYCDLCRLSNDHLCG